MGDLISREEVLKMLEDEIKSITNFNEYDADFIQIGRFLLWQIKNQINKLPTPPLIDKK